MVQQTNQGQANQAQVNEPQTQHALVNEPQTQHVQVDKAQTQQMQANQGLISQEKTIRSQPIWPQASGVKRSLLCFGATNPFMQLAIQEAYEGITAGDGGPFGAVVVKEGVVIASGHNHVLSNCDPTCHGEIDAIRKACRKLDTHDLTGCELYTTGEPCPMCLGAILWANIEKVYYGCTLADNEMIGFRDNQFDQIMGGRDGLSHFLTQIDREACLELFEVYQTLNSQRY